MEVTLIILAVAQFVLLVLGWRKLSHMQDTLTWLDSQSVRLAVSVEMQRFFREWEAGRP